MASTTSQSSGFELLNDDTLELILEYVGPRSYYAYGAINKRCHGIYLVLASKMTKETFRIGHATLSNMLSRDFFSGFASQSTKITKETFIFGYAPLSVIRDRYSSSKWLSSRGIVEGVVQHRRLDVLLWAIHGGNEFLLRGIVEYASEEGHVNILKDVLSGVDESMRERLFRGGIYSENAVRAGKLELLKWLNTNGLYINKHYCPQIAAKAGHLNILQWLNSNGFLEGKEKCANDAAEKGHLHILKWLNSSGLIEDKGVCAQRAAEAGHIHILEWLQEVGYSLDEETFAWAASGRSLEILEWLRNKNCPWHKCCYEEAAISGRLNVLDWLQNHGCPWGDNIIRTYGYSFNNDVVSWLRDNGFSIEDDSNVDDSDEDDLGDGE